MAVRSKQLATNAAVGTGLVDLYAVPAGYRTIVKSIVVQNQTGAASHLTFYVINGSTTLATFAYFAAAAGASGETVISAPWIVLETGDHLKANASAGTYRTIVSGAELLLPP